MTCAKTAAAWGTQAVAAGVRSPEAGAAGSPTHLYTYEDKGIRGFHMREGRNSGLKYGECLKTFGKTIEGRFSYHDDMGTTSDHSYYYKDPVTGKYRYFYQLLSTSRGSLKSEVFVEDSELAHCPGTRCYELAHYDPQ